MKKIYLSFLIAVGILTANAQPYSATLLKDIKENSLVYAAGSTPGGFTKAGDYVYFTAIESGVYSHVWRTDGTEAGTEEVSDSSLVISMFGIKGIPLGNNLIGLNGTDVVAINGTTVETIMQNVSSTSYIYAPFGPKRCFELNNKAFFWATTSDNSYGIELYSTDGTTSGTALVKDINPSGDGFPYMNGSNIKIVVGSVAYFIAFDGDSAGVYKTDGTTSGTVLIKNLSAASYYYVYPKLINGHVMISNTTDLWSLNTSSETITHLETGVYGPSKMWDVNNKLVVNRQIIGSHDIITTDGVAITTLLAGSGKYLTQEFVTTQKAANGNLFLLRSDNVLYNPIEVWKTDGSTIEKVIDSIFIASKNYWYAYDDKILWYNYAHLDASKSYKLYEINTTTYEVIEAFDFTASAPVYYPLFDIVDGRFYFAWSDPVAYLEPHYISLDPSASVNEKEAYNNKLEVYPNPVTNNELTVSFDGEYSIEIFSITGKLVYKQEKLSNTQVIRTNTLKSGLYFIKATNKGTGFTNKFIVE